MLGRGVAQLNSDSPYWVAIRKARKYICPAQSGSISITKIFRAAYADEIEVPGVELVSAPGGVEVGWFPAPVI